MKLLWKTFKRNTDDPLVRTFIDKYHLHLLSIPRVSAYIGDLYRYDGKQANTPGKISYFLEPTFEISNVTTGEKMADISGTISKGIDVNVGVELLQGFLIAMGAGGIINKIQNSFESKNTHALKFRFADITRDYVDPYWLSEEISDHTIKKDSAMYGEGYRYFLVTAVVRSTSISIIAEDEVMKAVDVDVEALQLLSTSANISVQKSGKGELTFKGTQNLVFGVELYELLYDTLENCFRFNTITETVKLRDKDSNVVHTDIKPAFIGDPQDGDVFLPAVGEE